MFSLNYLGRALDEEGGEEEGKLEEAIAEKMTVKLIKSTQNLT